jgi:CTP-dependent riboflavin kinase
VHKTVLDGRIKAGCGDAKHWGIEEIRKATGRGNLYGGTINVEIDHPHTLRVDHRLDRRDRTDQRQEDLCFENCWLITSTGKVSAVIARTSTNFWGDNVLEIMAEWVEDLQLGDPVEIEVWTV